MAPFFVPLLSVLLASCWFSGTDDQSGTSVSTNKDLASYESAWSGAVWKSRESTASVPESGSFEFELTGMSSGSGKSFVVAAFPDPIESLSVKIFWTYDSRKAGSETFDVTLKAYLNKRNFGLGDIDVRFYTEKGATYASFKNLDRRTLQFLSVPAETINELLILQSQWESISIGDGDTGIASALVASVREAFKKSPVQSNTAEEESAILQSFLGNKVFRVVSGTSEWSTDTVHLVLNGSSLVDFFNDVSKILSNREKDTPVDFSSERDFFSKLPLEGEATIVDGEMTGLSARWELPISWVTNSGTISHDLLLIGTNASLPTGSDALRFDVTNAISSKSNSGNSLQLRIRWFIQK